MRSTGRLAVFVCLVVVGLAVLGACGRVVPPAGGHRVGDDLAAVPLAAGQRLKVVATTTILGDVVRNVGGDRIELTVLMGIGVDPHTYVPTPADTVAIHDAHVVYVSGAGLEANLEKMLEAAGGQAAHIDVSARLELAPLAEEGAHTEADAAHGRGDVDPHVWFSVPNVIGWVEVIEQTLSALDPGGAETYRQSARAYARELEALDAWIQEQVAQIPDANRKLVTNHSAFGYFARRYGLEQVGAVYPVSPSAEPSARDIATLQDAIRAYGVPAVFTESTVSPRLAQQVARDMGVRLVPLFTGSLGGPGSGAETYVGLMRYDVSAIVGALSGK